MKSQKWIIWHRRQRVYEFGRIACVSVGLLTHLWDVLASIFNMDKMMNINGPVACWPFLRQEARSDVNDGCVLFRGAPIVRSPSLSLRLRHLMDVVFHAATHQNGWFPCPDRSDGGRGNRYDVKFARWRSGHSALFFQPLIDTHNYSNGGFLNRSGVDVGVEHWEPEQTKESNCSQIWL